MSGYGKMKVDDLRALCAERELIHDGLLKPQLIDLLRKNDAESDDQVGGDSVEGEDDAEEENAESSVAGSDKSSSPEATEVIVKSPEIRLLELQIALAREKKELIMQERELEKERKEKAEMGAVTTVHWG